MNQNAKQWVEALRSGNYKQGYGQLRKQDKFCCLGVACDIYDKNIWKGLPDKLGLLPEHVREWLGLSSNEGYYYNDHYLTSDNDSLRLGFNKIADIIESEPTGLFINE